MLLVVVLPWVPATLKLVVCLVTIPSTSALLAKEYPSFLKKFKSTLCEGIAGVYTTITPVLRST